MPKEPQILLLHIAILLVYEPQASYEAAVWKGGGGIIHPPQRRLYVAANRATPVYYTKHIFAFS